MSRAAAGVLAVAAAIAGTACSSLVGPPYQTPPPPAQPGTPQPTYVPPPAASPTPPVTPPQPTPPPPTPPPWEYRLGAATTALVAQARRDAASGSPQLAEATIERALRIEPANPLLWIMLGQTHQSSGQYELADSMGHKALQLAQGDPHAQASAWRLIGDSLRAQGRNPEADDAYSHADTLAPQ